MTSPEKIATSWRHHTCLWAMHPGALRIFSIASTPEAYISFEPPPPQEPVIVERDSVAPSAAVRLPKSSGNVAVVPIMGPIGQNRRVDWASAYSEEIAGQVASLAGNDSIGAIVLNINSPGGIVYGTPELAAAVRSARDAKPVYAVATGMAASAAYWIGAQATKLYAAPSAEVGSIGVWSGHIDVSKQMERWGLKVTLISAGEYKVEGNPYEPLSDEARADMQLGVDSYYNDFLTDVAKGRNTSIQDVRENYGKGRMLRGDAARKVGMIDGIASLSDVLGAVATTARARQRADVVLERMGLAVPHELVTEEQPDAIDPEAN